MNQLMLIEPSLEYRDEYLDMINEWSNTGERMIPFILRFDCSNFDSFLEEIQNLKTSKDRGENKVNSSTFLLVNNEGRVLGATNIRHELNEQLLKMGGHIGYGIRPSERKKGYATRLLAMALEKARSQGVRRVLVTCDKNNIGSARTILNNKGSLDSEDIIDGVVIQRYWIKNNFES